MNAQATQTSRSPLQNEAAPASPPHLGRIRLPSLRLRVSERRMLLFVMDLVMVNGALSAGLLLRNVLIDAEHPYVAMARWFVILSVVWIFAAMFFDCYDLARSASTTFSLRASTGAALCTVVVYSLIPVYTPPLHSRGFIIFFLMAAVGGVGLWRFAYARIFVQPWFKQQALIVGAGWAGRTLVAALTEAPANDANPFRGTGYRVVGFVDDAVDYDGSSIAGVPVLGASRDLVEIAQQLGVDEIVVAITHRHAIHSDLFDALLRCRELGFRLTTMSVLYERLMGRVPIDHIGRDLQMVVPMDDSAHERAYQALKRGVDLLFGVAGVTVMALLIPFVALGNALTSPGPLFYHQERVGRGGRTFKMLKFRSMVPDAECHTGARWACANDDRITFVGRIVRKARLDEIPQAVNILRGEMSLIGPRPERPEFVTQLAREIPFYRARHAVRPGITGWAQVEYEYGNTMEDAKTKLEYDLYYVKHAGLLLDLRIMLTTLPVMLSMRGL